MSLGLQSFFFLARAIKDYIPLTLFGIKMSGKVTVEACLVSLQLQRLQP